MRRAPSDPAAAAAAAGARYRHLTLRAPASPGQRPGERRVPGHPQPTGVEVEAWRGYDAGDDLRHLDWSALARLDTLLVRRFTAEREVVVHLLLDASGSMGTPADDGKLAAAAELVLALAAIALGSDVAVRLVVLRAGAAPLVSPLHRRAPALPALASALDALRPHGPLALDAALGAWARQRPERAAAFVVSDFLVEPATLAPALRALGRDVHLLQVLGASELHPARALRSGVLIDAETGATHAVALDAETLAAYGRALDAHTAALHAIADAAGATCTRLAADDAVPAFVTGPLLERGIVRPWRR